MAREVLNEAAEWALEEAAGLWLRDGLVREERVGEERKDDTWSSDSSEVEEAAATK